jgi:hypothetical protein
MNDLLTKIKTLNYKQFALQHGEKIGLGIIGLVAVICLGMTNWASDFTGTPEDMVRTTDEVDRKLKSNPWPEPAKQEFLAPATSDVEVGRVLAEVDLKKYEWTTPMSPKLYPKQSPADEVDWVPVTQLYARSGQMPMAVVPPPASDTLADEPADRPRPARPAPKRRETSAAEGLTLSAAHSGGSSLGAGAAGYSAMSAEKARGVRFNVVVGVVNVQEQFKALRNKLHLDSVQQAKPYLEYVGFRLERQRAVPGPDPWAGPWKEVNTDNSMDVLGEASDYDPEIVSASATNGEITSPLPRRLDAEWDPNLVGHPAIQTLTEEQQTAQEAENRAASELAGDDDDADGAGRKKGFSRIQKDANKLRDRAMSREGGAAAMADIRAKMAAMYGSGRGGAGAAGHSAGRGGSAMPPAGMSMGGARGMPPAAHGGGNMGMLYRGGSGMPMMGAGEIEADLLLFRYFDFDVEPGECYRYRVRLITKNPSFGETFVNGQQVAEGETRETAWSVPSTAAAVDRDVEYALLKASERGGRRDGAELEVVQFDMINGTMINDKFKVPYGGYVGMGKKSLHLDLVTPAFEEEDVTFRSQDVLLDSAGAPNLSESVKKDLNLNPKKLRELAKGGELDLAVTVNRFGEIVELDADSNGDLKPALNRVKEEREPYKDLREPVRPRSELAADSADSYNPRKRKKSDSKNPLKAGGASSGHSVGGAPPGMPPTGMPPPGTGRGGRGSSARPPAVRND